MTVKPPRKGKRTSFQQLISITKNTFGCIGMYQQKYFVPKIFRCVLVLYGEEHRKQLMLRKS